MPPPTEPSPYACPPSEYDQWPILYNWTHTEPEQQIEEPAPRRIYNLRPRANVVSLEEQHNAETCSSSSSSSDMEGSEQPNTTTPSLIEEEVELVVQAQEDLEQIPQPNTFVEGSSQSTLYEPPVERDKLWEKLKSSSVEDADNHHLKEALSGFESHTEAARDSTFFPCSNYMDLAMLMLSLIIPEITSSRGTFALLLTLTVSVYGALYTITSHPDFDPTWFLRKSQGA